MHSDRNLGSAMAQLIEAWGGMVEQVQETTEALRALERGGYDTVMLDRPLGEQHEREEVSKIAAEVHLQHGHLIVAADSQQECRVAHDLGAETSLARPLSGKDVLDSLMGVK